jgi:sec-independent protein translocase protein TatA
MLPNFGPAELVIILVIVLVIFGAGRLAGVGKALGQSVREFRDATGDKADAAKAAKAAEATAETTAVVEEPKA